MSIREKKNSESGIARVCRLFLFTEELEIFGFWTLLREPFLAFEPNAIYHTSWIY
jgi:hypothetical protein